MARGGGLQHFNLGVCRNRDLPDETVPFTQEKIAHVQGHRHAVFHVQGLFLIALYIAILDVIVNEGSLVEALNGHRQFLQVVGRSVKQISIALLGHVDTGTQEGAPALAGPGHPGACNLLGLTRRVPHDGSQGVMVEPARHGGLESIQIEPVALIRSGEVQRIPDPVDVNGGVDAVILEEGDGNTGNRRRLQMGEALLEDIETAHAHNGFDGSCFDHFGHQSRAFSHQDGITKAFRFHGQIMQRAQAALLAQEPEFVERRRTELLHPQAFGHEEETLFIGDPGQIILPGLVVHQNAQVVPVNGVDTGFTHHRHGMITELGQRERRHHLLLPHVLCHRPLQHIPHGHVIGDVGLGRPVPLPWHPPRKTDGLGSGPPGSGAGGRRRISELCVVGLTQGITSARTGRLGRPRAWGRSARNRRQNRRTSASWPNGRASVFQGSHGRDCADCSGETWLPVPVAPSGGPWCRERRCAARSA